MPLSIPSQIEKDKDNLELLRMPLMRVIFNFLMFWKTSATGPDPVAHLLMRFPTGLVTLGVARSKQHLGGTVVSCCWHGQLAVEMELHALAIQTESLGHWLWGHHCYELT